MQRRYGFTAVFHSVPSSFAPSFDLFDRFAHDGLAEPPPMRESPAVRGLRPD